MSAGPLRRLVGLLGLLALLPTAVLLTAGTITVEDAAVRGGATLLAALALGRVAGWGLRFLAAEFERAEQRTDSATGEQPATVARRRATDLQHATDRQHATGGQQGGLQATARQRGS